MNRIKLILTLAAFILISGTNCYGQFILSVKLSIVAQKYSAAKLTYTKKIASKDKELFNGIKQANI